MSLHAYAPRDSPPSHTLLDQNLDPRVPDPVEVGSDGIPEGIVDITEIFDSIELVPSPDRVTELAYFPKEEDPEWVPTFFEEIPEGIEVNIINEGEYGEWDLLPESYEIDPDIPMWR